MESEDISVKKKQTTKDKTKKQPEKDINKASFLKQVHANIARILIHVH